MMRVVFVTGLSGAGKSTALRALEDVGFYCCDNLPLPLVTTFVDCLAERGIEECALSVDARQAELLGAYTEQVATLRGAGHQVDVLFLEADDPTLIRRYSETRRRHPLSGTDVSTGIAHDREILALLRADATIINTHTLNVHELKEIVTGRFHADQGKMSVALQSFGFKHGVPNDSDLLFDVRCLPNPHFDPVLGPMDGRHADVAAYVFSTDEARSWIDRIAEFLRFSMPQFAREGKMYLTISVGCTGGRHRSVAIVEELAQHLRDRGHILVRHRDLHRGASEGRG